MSRVIEPLSSSLIARIEKSLIHDPQPVRISGLSSFLPICMALTSSLATRLRSKPQLIVTPDLESAQDFREALHFFDPDVQAPILPAFDVGVYSNLYPNQRVIAGRLKWLFCARSAQGGDILIAPLQGLLQKTIPYKTFSDSTLSLAVNEELPHNFLEQLNRFGYHATPTVEDIGAYCSRGGIIDLFSPAHTNPIRIELFGDIIESLRFFDPTNQISIDNTTHATVLPAREALFTDDNRQRIAAQLKSICQNRNVDQNELQEMLRSISLGQTFYGVDFLLPYFYETLADPTEFFSTDIDIWHLDRLGITRSADQLFAELKSEKDSAQEQLIWIDYTDMYSNLDDLLLPPDSKILWADTVDFVEDQSTQSESCEIKTFGLKEFSASAHAKLNEPDKLANHLSEKFRGWFAQGQNILIAASSMSVAERLRVLLDRAHYNGEIIETQNFDWHVIRNHQNQTQKSIPIVLRPLHIGIRIPEENFILITSEEILGKKRRAREVQHDSFSLEQAEALSFGELQIGDFIVHRLHGVGIYEGLKSMDIDGAPAEFIELRYKDNDKLYLPVYRIGQLHKYSGPNSLSLIDKLGGLSWQKTQTKVKNQLRDVAAKLLKLYAKRVQATRPRFPSIDPDYIRFENSFPYQETEDQLRAIHDVLSDLSKDHPMDRLVCGDVGFGKTEVALRAAFKCAQDSRQVALIAPTTILTHQHFENFKRRFKEWPISIRVLNRFASKADVKQTIVDIKSGAADIVIGTHRLLSKDVQFKNLGMLIIDEEQKFGVIHKERLRHMRENVDTMALSATPIPRTLNMSLVGIRDLSLINTPPEDRLPTRTYVCKFDPETVRKAIESEISRGGQVFFLHNRVQSIDECSSRIREICPNARIAIAHGQMDEEQLEKTMLKFHAHELDILICTAIIESGMDIPRANTIFIDNAHTFGVSQLYQLRGRVGRSKERAYCYLILPNEKRLDKLALERLKIIQDNTALGSGIRVAQYDLELRGAGDILGEEQSGHINAVGYELYTELLEEAVLEQKGQLTKQEIEPEINLRIPALFPDKYIPDIRLRLYYYKTLSNIRSLEDIDRIENELRDQFGAPPEPVMNLLGLMVIRKCCRDLGVRDVSAGKTVITLAFTEETPLAPQEVIRLTTKENKKYQLSPDQRLKIRMNEITWPRVLDELEFLLKLCPQLN